MLKLAFTAVRQRERRCANRERTRVKFLVRKEWLAALIGVALAGAPMGAFNLWVEWFIEQRGHEEVDQVARRSLVMAERRAGMIIRTLAELAKRGVVHCSAADIDSLRAASFWTTPIKEISVISPSGQTLCTDIGVVPGERVAVSSHPLTADGTIMIELLRFGGHRHPMIQIRPVEPGNVDSLAALTPAELFLPLTSIAMDVAGGTALAITTGDGFPLAESGVPQRDARNDKDRLTATLPSERYNLVAVASVPRQQLLAAYSNLRAVGTVISGLIALTIIAFALILPARRRGDPVSEIERAFRAGEFVPHFQPVVDMTSGRLRGAEALVRWRKPDGSLVLPGSFIPLLESSGLILEVTRMLMRRVVAEVGEAFSQRPKLNISFNVAAAHFADETIVRDVREIFENSPIRLSQVTLELTERQPLENLTETRRVIAALQGLGVSVAIDDVGTGHSGLSYMLKLGVDTIKIDKMFIDAIGTDRNSATIIETLIELARNLRMDIVAEGVESFEQVVFLRDLGIRAAQGYVFAPPLPASSYLQLIAAIDPLPRASAGSAPPPAAAGPKGRAAVA